MRKKLLLFCAASLVVCSSFALTTQVTALPCYQCPGGGGGGGGGGEHAKSSLCSETRNGITYYGWEISCLPGGASCNEIDCTA